MKLTNMLEGGLAGISTVSLLQEALHKIDGKAPRPLFHNARVIKKLKKANGKPRKRNKHYIQLAGELLANAAYFGLAGLGKKKNAVLRGGLLGTAAGLGSTLMQHDDEHNDVADSVRTGSQNQERIKKHLLTVSLYTAGGLLAGAMIKGIRKKKKKSK